MLCVNWLNILQATRDESVVQLQLQQQPREDDDDDDDDDCVPQYAELAPSIRRTERVRVVDNSAAVYASIVHPPRHAQP